jgi:hypothetical protein
MEQIESTHATLTVRINPSRMDKFIVFICFFLVSPWVFLFSWAAFQDNPPPAPPILRCNHAENQCQFEKKSFLISELSEVVLRSMKDRPEKKELVLMGRDQSVKYVLDSFLPPEDDAMFQKVADTANAFFQDPSSAPLELLIPKPTPQPGEGFIIIGVIVMIVGTFSLGVWSLIGWRTILIFDKERGAVSYRKSPGLFSEGVIPLDDIVKVQFVQRTLPIPKFPLTRIGFHLLDHSGKPLYTCERYRGDTASREISNAIAAIEHLLCQRM